MRRSTGFLLGAVAAGAVGWAVWPMLAGPAAPVRTAPGERAPTGRENVDYGDPIPTSRGAAPGTARSSGAPPSDAARSDGVLFTGTVVDADGGPVAGALVELGIVASPRPDTPGAATVVATVQTQADGTFAIEGFDAAATHQVRITHADGAPWERVVDRDAVHDLGLVRFPPGVSQRVRVVADGQPLAGAHVLARAAFRTGGDPLGVIVRAATSDGDGACVLRGLPDGVLRITAEAAGFAAAVRVVQLAAARVALEGADAIALTLAPGAPLVGQFRGGDATGLSVIARHARHPDGSAGPPEVPSLVAPMAADGTFRFPAVAHGLWRVAVLAGDRAISLEHEIETDGPPGTWDMPAVGAVHFTITLAGTHALVARGGVRMAPASAPPGLITAYAPWRDGDCVVRGMPAGQWHVEVRTAGHPAASVRDVTLVAGRTTDVPVTVPEGGALDITVTDDTGAPVDGARVQVFEGAGSGVPGGQPLLATARTAVTGRVIVTGLAAAHAQVVVDGDAAADPATVDVVVADGVVAAVRTVLTRGGVVEGTVRDAAGRPDGAAGVDATRLDRAGPALVKRGTTDTAGRYRITGLAPGRWRLRCALRAGQPAVSQADVGNEEPVVVTVVGAAPVLQDW